MQPVLLPNQRRRDWWFLASAVCAGTIAAYAIMAVVSMIVMVAVTNASLNLIGEMGSQASQRSSVNGSIAHRQLSPAAAAKDFIETETARLRVESEARRRDTPRGKDLRRRCDEFTATYQTNGGPYAREQAVKSCDRYAEYIRTGTVPP